MNLALPAAAVNNSLRFNDSYQVNTPTLDEFSLNVNENQVIEAASVKTPELEKSGAVQKGSGSSSRAAHVLGGACAVCGDTATGMYFGAVVCVPCKTFFLRYDGEHFSYECKFGGKCQMTVATRTHCKKCRYEKCKAAKMKRKLRPIHGEAKAGQQLCVVCSDIGNGIHFGALTCEGCKKFFRRGLTEHGLYSCKNEGKCEINPRTRNGCRACRYQKCLAIGMSRDAIQMGRPSKMITDAHERDRQPLGAEHQNQLESHSAGSDNSHSHAGSDNPINYANTYLSLLNSGSFLETANHQSKKPMHTLMDERNIQSAFTNLIEFQANQPHCKLNVVDYSTESNTIVCSNLLPNVIAQPFPPYFVPNGANDSLEQGVRASGTLPIDFSFHCNWSDNSVQLIKNYNEQIHHATEHKAEHNNATSSCFSQELNATNLTPSFQYVSLDDFIKVEDNTEMKKMKPENLCSVDESQTYFVNTAASVIPKTLKIRKRHLSNSYDSNLMCSNGQQSQQDEQRRLSEGDAISDESSLQIVENMYSNYREACDSPESRDNRMHSTSRLVDNLIISSVYSNCLSEFKEHQNNPNNCGSPVNCSAHKANQNSCSDAIFDEMREPRENTGAMICEDDIKSELESAEREDSMMVSSSGALVTTSKYHSVNHQTDKMSDEMPEDRQYRETMDYWLQPALPNANVIMDGIHWRIMNTIVPAYNRFVSLGSSINKQLEEEFNTLDKTNGRSTDAALVASWINDRVIPAYTVLSVTYCKSLPDFSNFNTEDQLTIIKFGQSPSRILAASLHWYDSDRRNFRKFLSWREKKTGHVDKFKEKLISYADEVTLLECDPIEAALLNSLLIIATDYPNIKSPSIIQETRQAILSTFQAYITAKLGTPNNRLHTLFKCIPEVRRLGLLHHQMTRTQTIMAEDVNEGT